MIFNMNEVNKEIEEDKPEPSFEDKVKQLDFDSEMKYKESNKQYPNNKLKLSVFSWKNGICSIRTFGHNSNTDYFVLTDKNRKLLIKQLQLADKKD